MASLLYHWNFTGNDDLSLNEAIYDSESNLVAKVKRRGTYDSSSFSISADGIELDNNNSTNGGYYIELDGLNSVQLGGNISIEMVVKNNEFQTGGNNKKSLYFSSTTAVGELTTSGASIVARFAQGKTKFLARPDATSNVTYGSSNPKYRNVDESSNTAVNEEEEHHYIFTIFYDSSANPTSSIKIYIDGDKKGENTADLEKSLTNTVRGSNLIGTHKEQTNATYLKGVVKYLKIYQGAMTDSEATSIYNNYNNSPYYSDYSGASDSDKYIRRHTSLSDYFTNNPSISSFSMTGNQLGLLNPSETYTIHKFTNGGSIDISSGYNYVPLSGQNNHIIFKNDTTWYKITQTSADNGTSTNYKYEISTDSGSNYGDAVTGKTFGDTLISGDITICFGGAESGVDDTICFHENTQIQTDQGEVLIKDLTINHTIEGAKIVYLIKSPNKAKELVLIEKNAFGLNKPSRDILLTKNHTIIINNKIEPVCYLVNNKTIKLVNNRNTKADVYNIFLLNKEFITINNLELGVINVSNKQLNILNGYVNKNLNKIEFQIQNTHKNIKNNMQNYLSIQDYKHFNNL